MNNYEEELQKYNEIKSTLIANKEELQNQINEIDRKIYSIDVTISAINHLIRQFQKSNNDNDKKIFKVII